MTLRENHAAFRQGGHGKVVLLLDASESAARQQEEIVSLAQEVLAALPADVERGLFFLGTPVPYPPADLAGQAASWFEENRRRASLITPLWKTLAQDDLASIVVIGAGPIFDLEDWEGDAQLRRVLLVSVGDSLQGEATLAEELIRPSAPELLRRLHDPIVRVEISGPAFMPTWWDRPGYRLQTAEKISLVAERLEDYALTLRFLSAADAAVRATVTRAGGAQIDAPLEPIEPAATGGGKRGTLQPAEVETLRRVVRREPFVCTYCGRQHSWDTLRCTEGASILGEVVYPSLQVNQATGLVLLQQTGEDVSFEAHSCNVLQLGPETVVIQEGPGAVLFRYDAQEARWQPTDTVLEPYHPSGEGAYVVLL